MKKDVKLFAIDQHLSNTNDRIVPIEFLNLQRIADYPTEMETVQGLIDQLEAELSKYGYHIWTSDEYIEETEE